MNSYPGTAIMTSCPGTPHTHTLGRHYDLDILGRHYRIRGRHYDLISWDAIMYPGTV